MLATWLHHCLYFGIGIAASLLLGGLSDRRRGLPVGRGLWRRLPVAALVLGACAVWALLPMPWHLPLVVVVSLVCMGLLFRSALRQDAPPGSPSTKAGKGAA